MLIGVGGAAVADCLSQCGSSFSGIGLRLNLNSNSNSTRIIRPRRAVNVGLCVASLVTNSDSFEVGRLIGSYGFMNVTRSVSGGAPELYFFGINN